MVKADKPFNECHWIKEGIFLAGEYPRNLDEDSSQVKINQILNSGIKSFVDLTEEDELKPYAKFLNDSIKYRRFPIKDLSIPHSKEFVIILLDYIDSEISNNQPVYMHCWGGRGRTGTIAGCWLTRSEEAGNQHWIATGNSGVKTQNQIFQIPPKLNSNATLLETGKRKNMGDWFADLFGFPEVSARAVYENLKIEKRDALFGQRPVFCRWYIKHAFSRELRHEFQEVKDQEKGRITVSNLSGEAGELHCDPENYGALFQVASQFNLLEMLGPEVTPEKGISGYINDKTQGPSVHWQRRQQRFFEIISLQWKVALTIKGEANRLPRGYWRYVGQ